MARIALAQTTTTEDFDANLARALSLIAEAAAGGARLLAFPEVFLYLGGAAGKLAHAVDLEGPVIGRLREQAARHAIELLLGSVHERIPGDATRVHNTSVLLGADGAILACYRKRNLFDVDLPGLRLRESDTIAPGAEAPPLADTALGRAGLTVCFDLRYPELFRDLRRRGAELVFVPSSFTAATGAAHWEVLLRARAIENQLYIAAPAQFGHHNDRFTSYGHSALVDPWGSVVALAPEHTGLVYGEVDLDYLRTVRRRLPMRETG